MTAKRFTINDCRVLSDEQVLKILNQLIDENEQLKQVAKDFAENPTQHNLWKLRTVILKDSDVE